MLGVLIVIVVSAALCAGLIVLLRPLLLRYALARPNARSSHKVPTPQGGGIAVLAATLLVATAGLAATGRLAALGPTWGAVAASAVVLAIIGALDDMRPLSEILRLASQAIAVAVVVAVGAKARLLPESVPLGIELAFAVIAGLWFVNLVNFMDGIDWITVAEMIPIAAALALFAILGLAPP
jgi:UDP-N-acetylmuramyl pentapeptide phosphotransferase/UDP-N-acetylglucosamine-1-phosphate transferase